MCCEHRQEKKICRSRELSSFRKFSAVSYHIMLYYISFFLYISYHSSFLRKSRKMIEEQYPINIIIVLFWIDRKYEIFFKIDKHNILFYILLF
jgi:hypothetical protein